MQLSLAGHLSLPLFPSTFLLLPTPCASDHPCFASAPPPAFPQEESSGSKCDTHKMPNPSLILAGKRPIPGKTGGKWEISGGTTGFSVSQRQPEGLISEHLLIISLFPGSCAVYSDSKGTAEVG